MIQDDLSLGIVFWDQSLGILDHDHRSLEIGKVPVPLYLDLRASSRKSKEAG